MSRENDGYLQLEKRKNGRGYYKCYEDVKKTSATDNGSRKQKGFCVDNACKNDNDERR